jgi:hypothetical protein
MAILYLRSSIFYFLSSAHPLLDAPNKLLRALGHTAADLAGALDGLAGLSRDPFAKLARSSDCPLSPLDALPQQGRPLFAHHSGGLFGSAGAMRDHARPLLADRARGLLDAISAASQQTWPLLTDGPAELLDALAAFDHYARPLLADRAGGLLDATCAAGQQTWPLLAHDTRGDLGALRRAGQRRLGALKACRTAAARQQDQHAGDCGEQHTQPASKDYPLLLKPLILVPFIAARRVDPLILKIAILHRILLLLFDPLVGSLALLVCALDRAPCDSVGSFLTAAAAAPLLRLVIVLPGAVEGGAINFLGLLRQTVTHRVG